MSGAFRPFSPDAENPPEQCSGGFLPDRLVSAAAEYFDVDPPTLFSRRKHGQITAARRAIAHVLMDSVGWSSPRVARFFNQKHPSILAGKLASHALMRSDPVFFEAVERLREEIFCDYHAC